MWCLDPVNGGELIKLLQPHCHRYQFEVAWVGEGWKPLVEQCHQRLVVAFPDYELLAIKQKQGTLCYQAFPHQWVRGQARWPAEEYARLQVITGDIEQISAAVCEWCGAQGRLRDERTLELTLCDDCDRRFPDPPVPPAHQAGQSDS